MSKKVVGLVLCAMLFALCSSAEAQQPKKVPLIGNLWIGLPTDVLTNQNLEAFRQGLRDLGDVEGRNIAFADRYAEGYVNRFPKEGLTNVETRVMNAENLALDADSFDAV